ncbi:MAG: hypothetical protein BGO87_02500 [Flavobacteriia bacterium 40-80]|nr:MAG: hypothetical protein BGO87_02500 [Flavobacteriia bacterium 40-80]
MTNFTRKSILILAFIASCFGAKAQYSTGFENLNGAKSGWAENTTPVDIDGITWTLKNALVASTTDAGDMKNGSFSMRMRRQTSDNAYAVMAADKSNGAGTISFYYARANFSQDRTGISPKVVVRISNDAGATWTNVGDTVFFAGVDVLTQWTATTNISGDIRIKFDIVSGDNGKRINIDDLNITDYAAPAACEAPTNLVLTDNQNGSLTASWTAPATLPAIGYYIAVVPTGNTPAQADYFTAASSATTFTTDTLKNGTALADGSTYDVYVMAVCAHGAGGYATPIQDDVTVTDVACPAATALVLTDNTDGSLTASWTAPATLPAIGYYIAVVPTGTTPSQSDYFTATPSATTFTTDTLKNGTALADGSTYDVYVMAVCAHGAGGYATPIQDDVTITIAATPSCAAPTNLVVTDNGNGSVTASWTAPATLPAIGYYIAVVPTGNTPAQADYFTAASSATTFTTDTLKNGTALADGSTYDVHVMAVCAHGAGGYATPIQDDVTVTISSASCQDPANITITDNGNASVNISWTAPATIPQNGYYYAVVPQGTTPSVPNDYVNTSATSLTNINATTLATGSAPLTGGTTYTFHLRSFCFHGAGGYGNEFENDFTLTLGVNDIHSEISGIYPNPAETTLTIDTKAEEGIISIVDLTGKTIATSAIKGNSTTISVSDLPGGMYQVVLSTSNTTSVSKFVKK